MPQIVLLVTGVIVLIFGWLAIEDLREGSRLKDLAAAQSHFLRCIARLLMGFYLAGIGLGIAQFVR